MEAMYKDAGAAYQLLNNKDYQGIINLANDRLGLLQRLPGSDPADTMQVLQLAQGAAAGNYQSLSQLTQVLESANQQGLARGYYAAPAAPERITIKEGDSIFERTPRGGWESVANVPKPVAPVEYTTFDPGNGTQMYADGPYAGLSVGKVAELQRTGQIPEFGKPINPITQTPITSPLPQTMVPADSGTPRTREDIYDVTINGQQLTAQTPSAPTPNYSNLSTQEAAIRRQEDEQLQIERSRATEEEARKVAAENRNVASENRAVAAAEASAEEAEIMQDRIITEANQMYDIANRLLSSDTTNVTGWLEGSNFAPKFTGESQQQVSDFDALTHLLTLGNMGRMTGVLSETDIQILSDAATLGVNRRAGDKQFQNSLRRIVGAISRLSEAQKFELSPITYNRDYYKNIGSRLEIPINQQGILAPQTQDQINMIYLGEEYSVINQETGIEEVKTKTPQDQQIPQPGEFETLLNQRLIDLSNTPKY